jgi:hypothetical protein
MNWERDDFEHRTRYRLCRAGFALSALGLALMSLDSACFLALLFTQRWELLQVLRSPAWDWTVGVSITWATLLGPYLLWGRWSEPHWQRRAGLLVVLNLIDVGYWVLRHGKLFGLRQGDMPHPWLLMMLILGSSWVQFGLFASLAADVSAHLGVKTAPEAGQRARALAGSGWALWLLALLQMTRWNRWPLVQIPSALGQLLWTGLTFLRAVAAFQAAALCLTACRACAEILREFDRADRTFEPDHAGHNLDALRSRSEAADTWKPPRGDDWG